MLRFVYLLRVNLETVEKVRCHQARRRGIKKKPSDIDVKLIHSHWFIIGHGVFHINTKILYCEFYNNQVNSVQKHNNHDGVGSIYL